MSTIQQFIGPRTPVRIRRSNPGTSQRAGMMGQGIPSGAARTAVSRIWNAAATRFREQHGRPADPDEAAAACTDAELDELDRIYSDALGVPAFPALVK